MPQQKKVKEFWVFYWEVLQQENQQHEERNSVSMKYMQGKIFSPEF